MCNRIFTLFILFSLSVHTARAQLSLNIFPQETYIDLDAPGVTGFEINYQLFGSQTQAQATIRYFYCDNPNGTGTCYQIGSFNVLLNCNGLLCIPPAGQNTHFISEVTSLPQGFTNTCFPGDWYIVGQVIGAGSSSLNTNPTQPVSFAHSRPDLAPFGVDVFPNPDIPGQMIVRCTLVNYGPCPSGDFNGTIQLLPNTGVPVLLDAQPLASGEGIVILQAYDDLVPGQSYDAILTADALHQIDEHNEDNNTLTYNNVFDFPLPPEVAAFSPSSGTIASEITITGTTGLVATNSDFLDVNQVLINGVAATISEQTALQLKVIVPYYATSGPITLETIYGTSTVTNNNFTINCSPDFADLESGDIPFPWGIFNPDEDQSFELYTEGGAYGNSDNAIRMNHFTYQELGREDFIVLPNVCIDSDPNWKLKFDFAYAPYTDGNIVVSDNLFIIDIETNAILASFIGSDIATAPAQSSVYIPQDDQWTEISIDLIDYVDNNQTSLYLAIVTQNGFGNAMYFDNIRLDNTIPLDVDLISFTAKIKGEQVQLDWVTASEENNDFFMVEKSINGIDFFDLKRVEGAGTSFITNEYSIHDDAPVAGNNYYRLTQVDFDGSPSTSEIKEVFFASTTKPSLTVYPNPGNGLVQFKGISSDDATIEVYNSTGQLLKKEVLGSNRSIDLRHLPDGVYSIQVITDKQLLVTSYNKSEQ